MNTYKKIHQIYKKIHKNIGLIHNFLMLFIQNFMIYIQSDIQPGGTPWSRPSMRTSSGKIAKTNRMHRKTMHFVVPGAHWLKGSVMIVTLVNSVYKGICSLFVTNFDILVTSEIESSSRLIFFRWPMFKNTLSNNDNSTVLEEYVLKTSLEIKNGWVCVILWTGKVINKTKIHENPWFSDQ